MNGLIENNYKINPAWIKSCENFRNGENPYTQPKYFHTDDNMYIRDWYKAAYPNDIWGYKQINPKITFTDLKAQISYTFNDSVIYNRIRMEIAVNDGLNFGYIITD